MNADQWRRLSDWHNAWLDADADGRQGLRAELTLSQPDLVAPADDLVADSSPLRDFMETPAFVLAARRMAQDTMSLLAGRRGWAVSCRRSHCPWRDGHCLSRDRRQASVVMLP